MERCGRVECLVRYGFTIGMTRVGVLVNRLMIAAGAALLLALTACTGSSAPTIAVGTCLGDVDPVSFVECTEPHRADVIGSETWPDMAARIAASDAATVYDSIVGEITDDAAVETADAYWTWANSRFYPLTTEATGLGSVTVGGVSAADMSLIPGGWWSWDASLAARDAFIAGDHSTLFSMTWLTAGDEQASPSYAAGVTIADIIAGVFPAELQGCFTRDPNSEPKYVDSECAAPHNGQYLFYADGLAALGADYMATVDPESTVFSDYGPLDAFCSEVIGSALPDLLDSDDWGVWSDQVNRVDGWAEYDGTIDPSLRYPVYCAILATSGTSLTGDVISGDVVVSSSNG